MKCDVNVLCMTITLCCMRFVVLVCQANDFGVKISYTMPTMYLNWGVTKGHSNCVFVTPEDLSEFKEFMCLRFENFEEMMWSVIRIIIKEN